MNTNYYTPAGVDVTAHHAAAARGLARGSESTVHDHKHGEPCNDRCKEYKRG